MTCKNRNNPIPRAYETPPFYGLQDVSLNIREKGLVLLATNLANWFRLVVTSLKYKDSCVYIPYRSRESLRGLMIPIMLQSHSTYYNQKIVKHQWHIKNLQKWQKCASLICRNPPTSPAMKVLLTKMMLQLYLFFTDLYSIPTCTKFSESEMISKSRQA